MLGQKFLSNATSSYIPLRILIIDRFEGMTHANELKREKNWTKVPEDIKDEFVLMGYFLLFI